MPNLSYYWYECSSQYYGMIQRFTLIKFSFYTVIGWSLIKSSHTLHEIMYIHKQGNKCEKERKEKFLLNAKTFFPFRGLRRKTFLPFCCFMINQNNKNSVHGVINLTESFLCFSLNPSLLGGKLSLELIFPFFL